MAISVWYLYLIRCRDGSLYTGISTDVNRRFHQHQGKGNAGSKYLKGRGPLALVFEKRLGNKTLALKVEGRVKKLSKGRKERLVEVPEHIEEIVNWVNTSRLRKKGSPEGRPPVADGGWRGSGEVPQI